MLDIINKAIKLSDQIIDEVEVETATAELQALLRKHDEVRELMIVAQHIDDVIISEV